MEEGAPRMDGSMQRDHRHILPGCVQKTVLCSFNLTAEGGLLKPKQRPFNYQTVSFLLGSYWILRE